MEIDLEIKQRKWWKRVLVNWESVLEGFLCAIDIIIKEVDSCKISENDGLVSDIISEVSLIDAKNIASCS